MNIREELGLRDATLVMRVAYHSFYGRWAAKIYSQSDSSPVREVLLWVKMYATEQEAIAVLVRYKLLGELD